MAASLSTRRGLLDDPTRLRAARAKALVLAGSLVVFAAGYGLTRSSHPSHAKHRLQRLDPPAAFTQQVAQDEQLRGGIVAAPQAPPEAQTSSS